MTRCELKSCPFCGGEALVVTSLSEHWFMVECSTCYCRTPKAYHNRNKRFVKGGLNFHKCKTDDEARALVVEIWNRRGGLNESE